MRFQKTVFLAIAMVLLANVHALDSAINTEHINLSLTEENTGMCVEGYHKDLELTIKNDGSKTKNILLFSETDLFLPQFNPKEFSLNAGEEKNVVVTINFNNFTNQGKHSIPVFAKVAGGELVLKEFGFELFECNEKESFDLDVVSTSFSMDKPEEKRVLFTVTNNKNAVQDISFSAASDLAVREGQFHFTLGPLESRTSFIEIETRKDDEPTTHFVNLTAWSEFGEQKKTVKVKIRKNPDIRIAFLQDDSVVPAGSASQIVFFEVELTNDGDEEETLSFFAESEEDTINATVSEEEINLGAGEKKTVRIIAAPSFDTPPGGHEIELTVKGEKSGFREKIAFNLTVSEPATVPEKILLKVVSAPVEINVVAGEKRVINVKIENPTKFSAANISTLVRGTDSSQFSFTQEKISELKSGQSASIDLKLQVPNTSVTKTYDLTLEIFSKNSFATAPFSLNVKAAPIIAQTKEPLPLSGFTSFLTLGEKSGIGLGILIIILIIAVGTILLFLLFSGNKHKAVIENYH